MYGRFILEQCLQTQLSVQLESLSQGNGLHDLVYSQKAQYISFNSTQFASFADAAQNLSVWVGLLHLVIVKPLPNFLAMS